MTQAREKAGVRVPRRAGRKESRMAKPENIKYRGYRNLQRLQGFYGGRSRIKNRQHPGLLFLLHNRQGGWSYRKGQETTGVVFSGSRTSKLKKRGVFKGGLGSASALTIRVGRCWLGGNTRAACQAIAAFSQQQQKKTEP